ncbi:MAG: PilZ domain-containing protein [Planctomycetota bacterium]|jgi:c-di-GMP-binding flagellar brake protein YcgR
MGGSTGDEKRQFVRVGAALAVRIRLADAKVDYPAVFTRDVSSGGIGLEIGAKWPDSFNNLMSWDGPADVEIDIPPDHVCHARAVVVWGHVHEPEGAERRFRVGLRFVDIADSDRVRLLDHVRSKMVESMLEEDKARREGKTPSDPLP